MRDRARLAFVVIASLILGIIVGEISVNIFFAIISLLLTIVFFVSLLILLFAIVIEMVIKDLYFSYINKLRVRIGVQDREFSDISMKCYQEIDNIYLNSLDSAHREMVIMRREQEIHNKKMEQIEVNQLEEVRTSRRVQELLLQIEQEREERYKKY